MDWIRSFIFTYTMFSFICIGIIIQYMGIICFNCGRTYSVSQFAARSPESYRMLLIVVLVTFGFLFISNYIDFFVVFYTLQIYETPFKDILKFGVNTILFLLSGISLLGIALFPANTRELNQVYANKDCPFLSGKRQKAKGGSSTLCFWGVFSMITCGWCCRAIIVDYCQKSDDASSKLKIKDVDGLIINDDGKGENDGEKIDEIEREKKMMKKVYDEEEDEGEEEEEDDFPDISMNDEDVKICGFVEDFQHPQDNLNYKWCCCSINRKLSGKLHVFWTLCMLLLNIASFTISVYFAWKYDYYTASQNCQTIFFGITLICGGLAIIVLVILVMWVVWYSQKGCIDEGNEEHLLLFNSYASYSAEFFILTLILTINFLYWFIIVNNDLIYLGIVLDSNNY